MNPSAPALRIVNQTWTEWPVLMGIVNVTPDSFSDGGRYFDPTAAVEHGVELVRRGAHWLDVGGESTRPGADPVPADEELRRVLPVVERLVRRTNVPVSIDTYKAEVARAALDKGASIINDVTGFRDSAMIDVAANSQAACIVMHMRGTPIDMMDQAEYGDVVADVKGCLRERLAQIADAGVAEERTVVDPGIGFAKRKEHNLRILNRLGDFLDLGRPICIGASRKRVVGEATGKSAGSRLAGTIAAHLLAYLRGAHIHRVHDVEDVADAIRTARAIEVEGVWAAT